MVVVSKPIIAGYPLSVSNLALMPGLDPTMIDGPGVVRRRKAQGKMAFHRMNSLMGMVSSSNKCPAANYTFFCVRRQHGFTFNVP